MTTMSLHDTAPLPVAAPPADLAELDDQDLLRLIHDEPASSRTRAAACEILVVRYELLVSSCARRYQGSPESTDELMQVGYVGLMKAINRFDPGFGTSLAPYALACVSGEIKRHFRDRRWQVRVKRSAQELVLEMRTATADLSQQLQRTPTESEIAQKLGVDVERWRQMMVDLRSVGLISASSRTAEHDDLPAPDFPSKPETQPDNMCSREQMRSVLGVAMKTLPERYQKVVFLYYTNEMTMKEIGGILGINESRVSQIHKSALEKMSVVLQANGIDSVHAF